ncbi:NfeD family protein [Spiroplasma endosymbiont of Nephrotoma flavescens]|uniref:NfeD family protein n=1 Tax=Spiroplasma endosymbiont of Nephrotoma flavescens TaxID=3066302 RepID=UPI00313E5806
MEIINIIFMVGWLIIAILFLVFELVSLDLTSIWFSIGAMASLFSAAFQIPFYWQIFVFAVISVICLLSLKPLISKTMKKIQITKTNVDLLIGQTIKVIKTFDEEGLNGEAKAEGKLWTITSNDNEPLKVEQYVKVIAIKGIKLLVTNETEKK